MSSPWATINWQRQRILTLQEALQDLLAIIGTVPQGAFHEKYAAAITNARAALLPVVES